MSEPSQQYGSKKVLWIEPDQVNELSDRAAPADLPRLIARDSLADRVGRLVWFPEYYAKRHQCSFRELEALYPRLYRMLEADPVADVDRSRTHLPTPDELLDRAIVTGRPS